MWRVLSLLLWCVDALRRGISIHTYACQQARRPDKEFSECAQPGSSSSLPNHVDNQFGTPCNQATPYPTGRSCAQQTPLAQSQLFSDASNWSRARPCHVHSRRTTHETSRRFTLSAGHVLLQLAMHALGLSRGSCRYEGHQTGNTQVLER